MTDLNPNDPDQARLLDLWAEFTRRGICCRLGEHDWLPGGVLHVETIHGQEPLEEMVAWYCNAQAAAEICEEFNGCVEVVVNNNPDWFALDDLDGIEAYLRTGNMAGTNRVPSRDQLEDQE